MSCSRRKVSLFVVPVVVAVSFGCSGDRLTRDEIEQGRKAVESFLIAWKRGETPEKLKGQSIIAVDPDWTGGMRLLDFQITGTEGEKPPNPRFIVKLKLRNEEGAASEANVVYETNVRKERGMVLIGRDPFF